MRELTPEEVFNETVPYEKEASEKPPSKESLPTPAWDAWKMFTVFSVAAIVLATAARLYVARSLTYEKLSFPPPPWTEDAAVIEILAQSIFAVALLLAILAAGFMVSQAMSKKTD